MTNFLCNAKLEHYWVKKVASLNEQDFRAFRARLKNKEILKAIPEQNFDPDKAGKEWPFYQEMFMDGDEASAWSDIGVELNMSRVKGVASNDQNIHNTIYQISVANIGLMQIQRVEVLENCCTDELQHQLNEGWRILAVCPPNDARRPSYVVGHFEKEASR